MPEALKQRIKEFVAEMNELSEKRDKAVEDMDEKQRMRIRKQFADHLSLDCIVREIRELIDELYFAALGEDESIELPGFDHLNLEKELSIILECMDDDILAQVAADGKGQKFMAHLKTIDEVEPAEQSDIAK